ncbi:thiol peroxidase [bacterium]|nr:thiol peroxidase [bacterium]
MAQVSLKGNTVRLSGELPAVGGPPPDFTLTGTDLKDVHLADFEGKTVVLNIFPSLDTAVCAASVRRFNEEAKRFQDAVVLSVSRDLPFAHKRFCTLEGLEHIIPLSEMRDRRFSDAYGVRLTEGPMAGLLARSLIIIGKNGLITYTQLVPDIGQEPDYEAAVRMLEQEKE